MSGCFLESTQLIHHEKSARGMKRKSHEIYKSSEKLGWIERVTQYELATCSLEILEEDEVKTSPRSGVLTLRLRPWSVPRMHLSSHHRMRLEKLRNFPEFTGVPGWLKPFIGQYNQTGCREERLCSIYRSLSRELISEIRSACTAVVVLTLKRMNLARKMASLNGPEDRMESDQWLYEGIGLSDDELESYDAADFGIVRYDYTSAPRFAFIL
jgi:hypothetical protein